MQIVVVACLLLASVISGGVFLGIINRHGFWGVFVMGGFGVLFYVPICNSARKENVTSICGNKMGFLFFKKKRGYTRWVDSHLNSNSRSGRLLNCICILLEFLEASPHERKCKINRNPLYSIWSIPGTYLPDLMRYSI